MSAALETTNLTPDSMINCGNGTIKLFGRVIHDHAPLRVAEHGGRAGEIEQHRRDQYRPESRREESLQVRAQFGFGRKTGIELPGESAGMLRRLSSGRPTSIGSVAMGHEIGVTSLQLALAGAVVANGGMLVKPRLDAGAAEARAAAEERIPPEKPERVDPARKPPSRCAR